MFMMNRFRGLSHSVFGLFVMMVLLSVGSPVVASGHDEQPDMAMVTPSPMNFPDTVSAFQSEVDAAGWSILNENNMAGVLSERGFTVDPVMIFDVCSGQYSAEILERDEYRPVSAFMPCRVSIYQDSEGQVMISRMNVPAFLPFMPEGVAEVMAASSEEIEQVIESVVSQ